MFRFRDSHQKEIHLTPKTIVLKVGSNILCGPDKRLDTAYIHTLTELICHLMDRGIRVVLVSSGAIAAGLGRMKISKQSRSIAENQALAAIGQSRLMQVYGDAFERHGRQVAQVLLTRPDLEDRRRYLNARRAFEELLNMGVVPIVNENDTTAVEEIKFGGNDVLSALVAIKLKADLLILLTNVDGVYDSNPALNPNARLIPIVERGEAIEDTVETTGKSALGTGGMESKIIAAKLATEGGVYVMVANGRKPEVMDGLRQGDLTGTIFIANRERRQSSWSNWILSARHDPKCRIVVDAGARRALVEGKKSLLPAGVRAVYGEFQQGDVVDVVDAVDGVDGVDGAEGKSECFARGAVNYSSEEIERIKGLRSSQIEKTLGYLYETTVIHRDNLVVLE
ncbi:MAG: glutamate 5-kinase [Candidatus Sumerlaeota bacterium]|nr:glutamate 5-kinase [Candidatus Sumerlaeota bacterium]